jgi:hypothetical protein
MRYVIVTPEWGIYLGCCLGLGFWSKLDPVGQPAAVTFPTQQAAEAHMDAWECARPPGYRLHPIPGDSEYATIAECVQVGLEGWIDEATPTEGPMQ